MGKFDLLDEIVGDKLSSVAVVMDYLQLRFDGAGITAFTPVTVASGTERIVAPDAGFRDLLCAQIGKVVAGIRFVEGEALVLDLDDGSSLSVSLRDEDYRGPEAINVHGLRNGTTIVI